MVHEVTKSEGSTECLTWPVNVLLVWHLHLKLWVCTSNIQTPSTPFKQQTLRARVNVFSKSSCGVKVSRDLLWPCGLTSRPPTGWMHLGVTQEDPDQMLTTLHLRVLSSSLYKADAAPIHLSLTWTTPALDPEEESTISWQRTLTSDFMDNRLITFSFRFMKETQHSTSMSQEVEGFWLSKGSDHLLCRYAWNKDSNSVWTPTTSRPWIWRSLERSHVFQWFFLVWNKNTSCSSVVTAEPLGSWVFVV